MILKIELEIPPHWTKGSLDGIVADLSGGVHGSVTLTPGGSGVIIDSRGDKTGRWQVSEDAPRESAFIVTEGLPRAFGELDDAEHWAAEQCEQDRLDHTVMLVPRKALENAVTARYRGVVLCTLAEARQAP